MSDTTVVVPRVSHFRRIGVTVLVVLATLMLIEAIVALMPRRPTGGETKPALAPA